LPKSEFIASLNTEKDKNVPVKTESLILTPIDAEPKKLISDSQKPVYDQTLNDKWIAAFIEALKNRSADKLNKLVTDANLEKQRFARVDDPVSYLKKDASGKSINA
jgi:hypothetical protein